MCLIGCLTSVVSSAAPPPQVGIIPLWARKAVCCQLELWQKGLLWQNAATPLDATGGHVGLVHLLKIGQEVRSSGWKHWAQWWCGGRSVQGLLCSPQALVRSSHPLISLTTLGDWRGHPLAA